MKILCDLQRASKSTSIPDDASIKTWVAAALQQLDSSAEITIRIVDADESKKLNRQFRNKDKPTNVLAFPFAKPDELPIKLLGDLVICAPVLATEAKKQNKSLHAHWAHIVIHGCLHLQGYDHINEVQRLKMEAIEIELLKKLEFPNPYEEDVIIYER